jgi:hypothetical protein
MSNLTSHLISTPTPSLPSRNPIFYWVHVIAHAPLCYESIIFVIKSDSLRVAEGKEVAV